MSIEGVIKDTFKEVLEENDQQLKMELVPSSILLETGLDSLGFAILVAKLDDELGYDPFTLMENPFYPATYKEFVDVYEKYQDHRKDG